MDDKLKECISFLENLVENTELLAELPEKERIALMTAAGKLAHPGREEMNRRKKENKAIRQNSKRQKEREARARTGIRKAREETIFSAPLLISDQRDSSEYEEQELNSIQIKPKKFFLLMV